MTFSAGRIKSDLADPDLELWINWVDVYKVLDYVQENFRNIQLRLRIASPVC